MSTPTGTLLWRRVDVPGLEYFRLREGAEGVELEGTVLVALDGEPTQVRYAVACGPGWETRTVRVAVERGDAVRTLDLAACPGGRWEAGGRLVDGVDGCVDVDLCVTPSTNTLPIRRLALAVGESRDVTAAWVRFPDLTVLPLPQRYTRLAERRYLYESAGGSFRAELEVDERGVVSRYGDDWVRVAE